MAVTFSQTIQTTHEDIEVGICERCHVDRDTPDYQVTIADQYNIVLILSSEEAIRLSDTIKQAAAVIAEAEKANAEAGVR